MATGDERLRLRVGTRRPKKWRYDSTLYAAPIIGTNRGFSIARPDFDLRGDLRQDVGCCE